MSARGWTFLLSSLLAAQMTAATVLPADATDNLESGFLQPPDSARPWRAVGQAGAIHAAHRRQRAAVCGSFAVESLPPLQGLNGLWIRFPKEARRVVV